MEGELQAFVEIVKKADINRIAAENDRLEFERERFNYERDARERDRDVRNQLELEKIQAAIGKIP